VVKYNDGSSTDKQVTPPQEVKFKVNPVAAFTDTDGVMIANGSDTQKTTKLTLNFKYPVDLSSIGASHDITAIDISGGATFDSSVIPVQGADKTVWTIGIIQDKDIGDYTLITVKLHLNEETYAAQIAILNAQIPTISSDVIIRSPIIEEEPIIETDDYIVLEHFGTFDGSGTRRAIIDADDTLFVRLVHVGDEKVLIRDKDYTVTHGSTIITLTEDYIKTLQVGDHRFRAEFSTGRNAIINLTVKTTEITDNNEVPNNNEDISDDNNNESNKSDNDKNKTSKDTSKSDNNDSADNKSGGSASPDTSDAGNAILLILLMGASGTGIFFIRSKIRHCERSEGIQ
jgi:hypothetical protein